MHASPPEDLLNEHRAQAGPLRWLLRIVVGVAVIASFGVWIYALSGVARTAPPDELDSTRAFIDADEAGETYMELDGQPAFGQRAGTLCEQTISSLPNATEATSGPERATQVRASNELLIEMIAALRAMPVASDRDAELRTLWLDDWEVLIGDRERYADDVEIDPAAQFTVSPVADNERLERRLTRFARTNLMLACGSPTDIG